MITLPCNAHVDLQATSGDKPATISILAYGGGVMRPPGWGDVVVDLAGLEFADNIPLLADHENSLGSIVGSGRPEVRAGQLHITGTLARGTKAADHIIALSKSGVKLAASVGVSPTKIERLKAGESIAINGRTITAGADGLTVTRKGVLKETSVVGIGADSAAHVAHIAAKNGVIGMTTKTADFQTWVSEMGLDTHDMTGEQIAGLHANYHGRDSVNASDRAAVAPMITASAATDPVAAEDRRLRMIEAACNFDAGDKAEEVRDLQASAIRGEIDVDSLLAKIRPIKAEAFMKTVPAPRVPSSGRDHLNQQSLEASLLVRSGLEDVALKCYGEQTCEVARRHRISNLVDLTAAALQLSGRDPRSFGTPDEMIRAGFSTVALPTILSNTVGRSLVDAYMETTSDWRKFCHIASAATFHQQTGIRPTAIQNLEEVGAAGEIKHGQISEEATYPWSLKTFAEMIAITRRDIINDDLRVFSELGPMLGVAAGRSLADLVWSTILGGVSAGYFSSGNDNYLEAGSALGVGSLGTGVAAMRNQRDSKGHDLSIAPHVLVVPPALELTARNLLASPQLFGSTTVDELSPNGNPVQGIVPNLVVEPRLSNSDRFSGTSSTMWMLFGNPMTRPVIVGFLNGNQNPTIEIEQAPFNVLGTQLRVVFDFGVALGDPKAGLRATGAAGGG